MQKLDFSENIIKIKEALKSEAILNAFENNKDKKLVDFDSLSHSLIESKSNFDRIVENNDLRDILSTIGAIEIYESRKITEVIQVIANTTDSNRFKHIVFSKENVLQLYHLHYFILKLAQVTNIHLFHKEQIDNDSQILWLRLVLGKGNMRIRETGKIFNLLSDLVEIIQQVHNEFDIKSSIEYLDSGSDTNIGVKTGTETAKSIFELFKMIFEFLVSRKFYKQKLRNELLLDNLKVMKAIKEAEQDGIIDKEKSDNWKEQIIRKTEDLVELNVILREDAKTNDNVEQLLLEYNEIKSLPQG